jgi:uracil phosphoribosyltransferase
METAHKNQPVHPSNLTVIKHPLLSHKLSIIRNKNTDRTLFRNSVKEVSQLMTIFVTQNLALKPIQIETPLTTCASMMLADPICVVNILRAGLGMSQGVTDIIPEATVGCIGLYRDHDTLKAVNYLVKLPEKHAGLYIVVDPMLATGNSAIAAIEIMIKHGISVDQMAFMALIAAPEGVQKLQQNFPDLKIFLASLDEKLDDSAYIIPGLGDAGDRLFGT